VGIPPDRERAVHHHQADPFMQACIEHCSACHAVCLQTITHCLARGGVHAAPGHIALLATCADLCRVSADAMLRGSDAHEAICLACADVCRRCADDCERLGDDDPAMQHCVQACRRCAESCAAMASA